MPDIHVAHKEVERTKPLNLAIAPAARFARFSGTINANIGPNREIEKNGSKTRQK
jgi:hypothetical protein